VLARFLSILLGLSALAAAVDPHTLQPQGYVNDFAGVLDPAARTDLARYCGAVERATGVQIALVTVDTLGDNNIEDAANDLYHRWGIGNKETDEGLLLLLATKDHHSRLEVGRGLEPTITDGTAGEVLREMRPALQSGDYAAALGTAAHELGQRIASAKGVTITDSAPARRVRQQPDSGFPFPVGAFLVFLIIAFLLSRRRRGGRWGGGGWGGGGFLPGMILGNMMNRGTYGGHGGGGFGGYDSGDGGFGGFGGGDSGGGGASSSW